MGISNNFAITSLVAPREILIYVSKLRFHAASRLVLANSSRCLDGMKAGLFEIPLYEFNVKGTKLSWKTVGKNIITLRWIYRSRDARIKYFTIVHFYKKKNESRDELSRHWKMKTKDCKYLEEKINSKEVPWVPNPSELVQFYNTNCN